MTLVCIICTCTRTLPRIVHIHRLQYGSAGEDTGAPTGLCGTV